MYGKQLFLVYFLFTPLISFSEEPENVVLKDKAIKISPIKAKQHILSNKDIKSHNQDIEITIQSNGEKIIVDATFTVPVKPQLVWETLTDFDNIPKFISSVRSSKVINRTDNILYASQVSIIKIGMLTFSFESLRQINLFRFWKIRERMIRGDMRKMEETTQLLLEGNHTRIAYHANIVPNTSTMKIFSWVQNFIGQVFIEDEAREQFQEIIKEILRREKENKLSTG